MPVTIKSSVFQYKNTNGEYVGVDAIADKTTAEQVAQVNSAISAKITEMASATATNISAIETKGQQTLNSIPEDYTELSEDVENLNRAFENNKNHDDSINEALVNGNSIENLVKISLFEQGGLNSSSGQNDDGSNRLKFIRTHDYIYRVGYEKELSITVPSSYVAILFYYGADYSYISHSSNISSDTTVTMPENASHLRFELFNTNGITPAQIPSGFKVESSIVSLSVENAQRINKLDKQSIHADYIDEAVVTGSSVENLVKSSLFEQGGINSSTGNNDDGVNRLKNIRTSGYIYRIGSEKALVVSVSSPYIAILFYYASDYSYIDHSSNISSNTTINMPSNTTYLRIVLYNLNGITPEQIPNGFSVESSIISPFVQTKQLAEYMDSALRLSLTKTGNHVSSISYQSENVYYRYPYIWEAGSVSFVTSDNNFCGLNIRIYNPPIGKSIHVHAERTNGNGKPIRLDCWDVNNQRIGAENWTSTDDVEKTVVSGTYFVELTLAGCWGTAIGSGVTVSFSNITMEFNDIEQIVARVEGTGNNVYTGEKIALSNNNDTEYKCDLTLWKDFLPADIPDLADYKLFLNQSMVIYKGYVFMLQERGMGFVIDYATKSIISNVFQIAEPLTELTTNQHFNSAQFTDIFYDDDDEFPLLLIARCGNTSEISDKDECQVFRVTKTGSSAPYTFTLTLINKINCDFRTYGSSWAIDNNSKRLYMASNVNGPYSVSTDKPVGYWVWPMPTREQILSGNEIILEKSNAVSSMQMEYFVLQAIYANGSTLYVGYGEKNNGNITSQGVYAVDIYKNRVLSRVPLDSVITGFELEGVSIYNGKIYTSQKNGNDGRDQEHPLTNPAKIYQLSF